MVAGAQRKINDKPRGPELGRLVRRTVNLPAFTFSAEQSEVIAHRKSPLVVCGGAGTGKTTTLIESVVARLKEGRDPDSILILTYGRERASWLRDEIARRAGSTSSEPLARTFHSLAFSILNSPIHSGVGVVSRYVMTSGAEQDAAIKAMVTNPHITIPWHPELEQALSTRGFVRELRDLILRATELGLTAVDLRALGNELGEKYWDGAAHFWASYYGALELQGATVGEGIVRIDPSAIIHEALELLRSDPERLNVFRKRYTTIVVDEFQESDHSQRELLKILGGDELVIFADPDSAIGRFRGADPDGVVEALSDFAEKKLLLTKNFRARPELVALAESVSSRLKSPSLTRGIRRASVEDSQQSEDQQGVSTGAPITFAKLTTAAESATYIAQAFKAAHLQQGVPWSQMAVILRSPGQEVQALQRSFSLHGIPISVDASALALAENPVIKPLLAIAQISLRSSPLTAAEWPYLEEILLSDFGGADALQLRQIRFAFSKVRTDHRSTTEMMIDALVEKSVELPWEEIAPLKRINDLISAAKKSLRSSSDVSDLLWAIWNNAVDYQNRPIATLWRDQALAGGKKGAKADRDLDAMIALFENARRFTERNLGSKPQLFIDQIMGERILSDAIISTAQREEVVSIVTVHAAKGLEWDLVAIAGLQEGIWPNLKERGSLLGSERLVEAVRSGLTVRDQIQAAAASGLREDEGRLLYSAISRARARLLITAFANDDSQPSRYFDELYESVYGYSSDGLKTALTRSLTSQALVASLRQDVMAGSERSELAAVLLKTLMENGVSSANPDNWLGVRELSTAEAVVSAEQKIYVSPSSLSSFDDCGLKWFLERSGAQDGDSTAQLLGVAVHFIAQQVFTNPELTLAEGISQITQAWPVVDQNVGWFKDAQLTVAHKMLTHFFEWHQKNSRQLISVEEGFEVEFERIVLKGTVDRLELDERTGKYFIVDLKTGSAISTNEAEENKQLSAYQLAVAKGGFKGLPDDAQTGGAGLLFLKKDSGKNETVDQDAIIPEITQAEIIESAAGMSAATFTAVVNKRCRTCALKSLCPLQSQGRSVIE